MKAPETAGQAGADTETIPVTLRGRRAALAVPRESGLIPWNAQDWEVEGLVDDMLSALRQGSRPAGWDVGPTSVERVLEDYASQLSSGRS